MKERLRTSEEGTIWDYFNLGLVIRSSGSIYVRNKIVIFPVYVPQKNDELIRSSS